MPIQIRKGNAEDFDAAKMKSGELAAAEDTKQLYVSFEDGTAEEIPLKEYVDSEMKNSVKSHKDLTDRSATDQHPITAITGLDERLGELDMLKNGIFSVTETPVEAEFTAGAYYYGEPGAAATLREDSTAQYACVDVTCGEIYLIVNRGRYNHRAYLLTDENNIVVASGPLYTEYTNFFDYVQIPSGVVKMYVASAVTTSLTPYIGRVKYVAADTEGNMPQSQISAVTDAMTEDYTEITDRIPFIGGSYYNNGQMFKTVENELTKRGLMKVYKGEKYRVSGYSYYDARVVGVSNLKHETLLYYPQESGINLVDDQLIEITEDGYMTFSLLTTRAGSFSVKKLCKIPKSAQTNPLWGKKLCVDGDSICYGAGDVGGYAKYIGANNSMTVQNLAVSGATLATGTTEGGNNRHWICTSAENLDTDGDYYIIEGGYNDVGNSVPIGDSAYTDAINVDGAFDTTTTCGAMEQLCRTLVTKFTGKKLGFLFPHRINEHAWNYAGGTRRELQKKILRKYGIPFLDLAEVSGMDTCFEAIKETYTHNSDGIHPNAEGYKTFYVPIIEAWMRILGGHASAGGDATAHTQLSNRDAADQHPISAIAGLQAALNEAAASGVTDHAQLTNRNAADQHPITAITGLQEALEGITNDILNALYPVGAIYMSVGQTSPAAIYGGTWEQIKDTFLLSAGDTYTAGATGGEAAHTHTLDSAAAYVDSNAGTLCWKHKAIGDWHATWQFTGSSSGSSSAVRNSGISLHGTTDTTSNLPPYLAVYMWKRVA